MGRAVGDGGAPLIYTRREGFITYSLDYVKEQVKERVPLVDLIEHYTGDKIVQGKMRCPFHGEKTASFTIYPNSTYYCFGCSESGDVITFVRRWLNLGYVDALRRIDADFSLGLFGRQTLTARRRARADYDRRQKERRERKEAEEQAIARYWEMFDLVRHYEKIIEEKRPTSADEPPCPEFVDAIKHIERAQYRLEELEQERRKFNDNHRETDRGNDSSTTAQ